VNKSNLTYSDDIEKKQNTGQDVIKDYINYIIYYPAQKTKI